MLNLPNYARVLRCIGQALQERQIEAFELKSSSNDFRLLAGDPNPPYTALVELTFSAQTIEILDRQGRARRGQAGAEVRFDSIPEILRAVGEYIDSKHGRLQRIDNSYPSSPDEPLLRIEYDTRTGDLQGENFTMSVIREASVRMYKRRARLSNPVSMLTRKR
jgi:hypothetical protein